MVTENNACWGHSDRCKTWLLKLASCQNWLVYNYRRVTAAGQPEPLSRVKYPSCSPSKLIDYARKNNGNRDTNEG